MCVWGTGCRARACGVQGVGHVRVGLGVQTHGNGVRDHRGVIVAAAGQPSMMAVLRV